MQDVVQAEPAVAAAQDAIRRTRCELGRMQVRIEGRGVGAVAHERVPLRSDVQRHLEAEVADQRENDSEGREDPHARVAQQRTDHGKPDENDARPQRDEEVGHLRAGAGLRGGRRRENEPDRGQRHRARQRVPAQDLAAVAGKGDAGEHEQHADGEDDRRVIRLSEADEDGRPAVMPPPPRRDAEQQQHRAPRERLLPEQQRLEDRRIREHGGGPPTAPQLRERGVGRDDATDRSQRGP